MFLMPDQQLGRCDRVMQQRIEPHIYETLAHCTLRACANPGEPEPSTDAIRRIRAGAMDFEPFEIGGQWGTTWGTTWFEVSGRIDKAAAAGRKVELIVDLGWLHHRGPGFQAEGLVYRADGTAIKSANPRNCWIPLMAADGTPNVELDADDRFTVYIEAAANPFVEGPTPYSPTELGEEATGRPDFPYTLSRMDVCAFNAEMFDYWMDLETVSSLIRELKDDDPRYWQLAKALQRSLNRYDERHPNTVAAAREALAGVLAEPAASSAINHIAVGHAHIDSAWLWPVRETRRKVARTVSNVLALMDEDPDFTYAMSSAQQYAWLEQEHPDLFARMKERIAEGRFIPVGGMWVESDNMIPTGESLVRQITFGRRYFTEHLGVEPRGIWLPDSFGYSGAWPQIARRAGYDWFLTQKISWNDATKFPHHSFLWEGIDGSRILTHFPPSDTYCSSMSMQELMYSQRNYLDKDLSRNAILLYGFGDGGGGPTREMTARIRRDHDLAGAPKVEFGTPDELFDRVRKDIVDDAERETPVFRGELYLELHRGTLTAQQGMKRGCRREEAMLRATEYLCAAAALKDSTYVYPKDELDAIWQTLLLNQFHDILPGSAIAWVHRQARAEYERDIARLKQIAEQAGRVIKAAEPDDMLVTHAAIPSYAADAASAWTVRDRTASHDAEPVAVERDGGRVILDNGLLRATVEADGTVSSLVDLSGDRELVPGGTRLGRYELLDNEPFHWDAWEVQRDAFLTAHGLRESRIDAVDMAADGACVVRVVARNDDVTIVTCITLHPDRRTLDFSAQVDWLTEEEFLKVDIPLGVQATNAQYECQYGMVERPIQKNSRSDEAKFESCTHRFVRVADASYAAAVVNASTYGSDVSPIHGDDGTRGAMVRLSLLSAPLYPDPRTDRGAHEFAWSVVADASMPAVLDEATRLNTAELEDVPAFEPLARLDVMEGVPVLDWVKTADDGSGDLILRVYEATGGRAVASLDMCAELAEATVREVDVLEGDGLDPNMPRALDGCKPANGAVLKLAPFQLATLRISR